MTARISYEHKLKELHENLIEMGRLIETAIKKTFEAFEDKDYALAEEIIKDDRNINDMEKVIESRCLSLILRQQPVAGDLRMVSTALKVVTDMERIGDHASDIAELILRIHGEHDFHSVRHLPEMAEEAVAMVHDAIQAFVAQDEKEAQEIIKRDDRVDELFNRVKNEVIELLKQTGDISDQSIDFLMIAKYVERIGDHAVNICEWTEFGKTGKIKDVRIL